MHVIGGRSDVYDATGDGIAQQALTIVMQKILMLVIGLKSSVWAASVSSADIEA